MVHSLEDRIFGCHGGGVHQTNRSELNVTFYIYICIYAIRHLFSFYLWFNQPEQTQWGGAGYYGYPQGYQGYGYAQPAQDPNMYYGGYPGYTNYQQPQQVREVHLLFYSKITFFKKTIGKF